MKEFETLGDWCKWLEKNFSNEVMIPTLPVIIRLDGNNFSKWTKGLDRPFDEGLANLMIDTTEFLVKETNAIVGYTQSDEITLILYSDNRRTQLYNAGKKQKILSKLTGKVVSHFNSRRKYHLPDYGNDANFDCRIYQTPTLEDAVAQLIWRENDAVKNSISMLAQSYFSHNSLHGLNTSDMIDKLIREKNVYWSGLDSKYQRGSYIKRTVTNEPFTQDDLDKLPPKHDAHTNPDLRIERSVVERIEYPRITEITNLVDVIFFDKQVKTKD